MDVLLESRWLYGLSPFDGDSLVTDEPTSAVELHSLLSPIVPLLQGRFAPCPLYTFDDWHQHDGFVTQRQPSDWHSLATITKDAETLVASTHGDAYVHRAFYPEGLSFLLRYDISDEDGLEYPGRATFSLSADPGLVAEALQLIQPTLRSRLKVEGSKSYFDRSYAG